MRKAAKRIFKRFIILSILVALGASSVLLFFILTSELPNLQDFNERIIIQSTKIYARDGKTLLYDIHGEEKRTIISFEEIPGVVKNATIALEDDTFYQHKGIRPLRLFRAVFITLFSNQTQGGSTITQQLVKNTLLTPEQTVIRKLKEIVLAFKIERQYSKDEILNLYLNQIPYGSSAYGIESAAKTFFDKNARDLSTIEAAYLASLPNLPTYYSPYGKHRDELDQRAIFTLSRMLELNFISETEYKKAIESSVEFVPGKIDGIFAPHFTLEVQNQLNEMFGENVVERSGFTVITTIDPTLQTKAEEIIKNRAETNKENFNANNASMVGIDPKNGDILFMVGSKDFFGNPEPEGCSPGVNCVFDPQVNISLRYRQPGSALKPFVYTTAFKKGYTPETTVFDLKTEFNPNCTPKGGLPDGIEETEENKDTCYHPSNFDDVFRGPITLRESLAQSLNVPSVKVLYLSNLLDSLKTIKDFGITTLTEPDRYGLTLVLGGGEVSLLELTSAYSVFANDGAKNKYKYILSIKDGENNIIFKSNETTEQVVDTNIARTISSIISDNDARSPSFGEFSALYFPGKEVAAKTGTTNDYRDAWIIGYTPSITIGTWAGNNDNSPMEKRVAGFIVAPMWHDMMEYVLTNFSHDNFEKPKKQIVEKPVLKGMWGGGIQYTIDKLSGKLATEHTPIDLREEKVVRQIHSILHWVDKTNPNGEIPIEPRRDSQYENWETVVIDWAEKQGLKNENIDVIPIDIDDIHSPANSPKIDNIVISPTKSVYKKNDVLIIQPIISGKYNTKQIDYFGGKEEKYLGSITKEPYDITINLNEFNINQTTFSIKIKVYDEVSNTKETMLTINVN